MPSAPLEKEKLPMLRALDTHPSKPTEFIAGTDGCDIWEVRPLQLPAGTDLWPGLLALRLEQL
jgi:hypothetical protein